MLKNSKPIVGISVGDPNGIGIEVLLKSLKDASVLEKCSVVVFSNLKLIKNQMSYFNVDLPLKEVSHFNNYDENYNSLYNLQTNTGNKLAGSTLSVDPLVINPNTNILSSGHRITLPGNPT